MIRVIISKIYRLEWYSEGEPWIEEAEKAGLIEKIVKNVNRKNRLEKVSISFETLIKRLENKDVIFAIRQYIREKESLGIFFCYPFLISHSICYKLHLLLLERV